MFECDTPPQSSSDLLELLGFDGRAIRSILEEPAPLAACPGDDEGLQFVERGAAGIVIFGDEASRLIVEPSAR